MCVAHSSALLNWRLLLSNDLLLKVAHRVAFLVVSLGEFEWAAVVFFASLVMVNNIIMM